MKLEFINLLIGLDMPSGNNPVDSEKVENTLIFNSNLQEQYGLNYDHESNTKSQKLDKLIADKKSVMKIILNQCDEDTRAEIALSSSHTKIWRQENSLNSSQEYASFATILRIQIYFWVLG